MENISIDKIVELDKDKWQGYPLDFRYVTHSYYDVEINRIGDDFNVSFAKKPFDMPFEKVSEHTDKLFGHWWDDIKAWGIVEGNNLLAAIETSVEVWNNRLRVNELWINEKYRHRGIGTAMMDIAVKRARDENRRAVVLETQSCNEAAITFYLKYGFTLIGFDSCAYRNNDMSRREVRLELGLFL